MRIEELFIGRELWDGIDSFRDIYFWNDEFMDERKKISIVGNNFSIDTL